MVGASILCKVYHTDSVNTKKRFLAFFVVAKRETEAAQARSEARRSQPIHERPRKVGGTAGYSATITQKQKAVTAASKGLDIQVTSQKSVILSDWSHTRGLRP